MVVNTPIGTIPSYLRAVGILEPEGNVAADTASQVDKLLVKGGRRRLTSFAIAGVASGVLTFFAAKYIPFRFSFVMTPLRFDAGAPIMSGVVFGILVASCNWVFGLRDKIMLVALVVFTTIAWVLAYDLTMDSYQELQGFIKPPE
jgi:hypothetical protein